MVGQDERQLAALLVPKVEAILRARDQGLTLPEDLGGQPGDSALRKALMRECNRLLKQRVGARADERLAAVALVEPFSVENGLLTQTLKQRRDRITARDAASIAAIYDR